MSKKRIQWLDFAKGLTILSVIIIHASASNSYSLYVFDIFAMPLFFAISGYLYKITDTIKKFGILIYKKATSLLIPYFFFSILLLFMHSVHYHQNIISYIFKNIPQIFLLPIDYLWFLYVLFFIFIIVGIFNLIHLNLYIQIGLSMIMLFYQLYIPLRISNSYNPIRGICGYIICFYCGYILKKLQFNKLFKKKMKYVLFLFLFTIWVILIIVAINDHGADVDTDFFHSYDIVTKLLSVFVFFMFFISFPHSRIFSYFTRYGKYTLIIYLIHRPFLALPIFSKLFTIFNSNTLIIRVFLIILTWYISIFICALSTKFRIINFIFYPRKYINKIIKIIKIGGTH